jgi:ribosomal protein L37E
MSDPLGDAVDTALEHASADAIAGLAGGRREANDTRCLNCGEPLKANYCPECGQGAHSLRRPFWSLLGESVETLFSIDSRFAQTVPDLIVRPGRMTRHYLDGQRARFLPPFRLYVLASLIFFVLMPLVMGKGVAFMPKGTQNFEDARAEIEASHNDGDMTDEEYQSAIRGLDQAEHVWRGGIPGLVTPTVPNVEGDAAPPPDEEWAGFMPREALDAVREAGANGDKDAARFAEIMDEPGRLAEETQRWIPRMMFVLLPVYACLLALVYFWRRQFLFFDHLIVSLHFHSALFFAMSIGLVVVPFIGLGWVSLALIVYSNVYLYRLNRVVYGRGQFSSILRTLTLDSLYIFVLLSALLMAVILGALSL